MLQMLIGHFQHDHGDVPQVLIESPDGLAPGDFTSHPAPYRCDLCGVKTEPPWWTMVTPRTVDYKVEDPGWLVCDPCQVMVVANDLMGLVKRYMQQASHTYAVTRSEAREIALDLMPGFLQNVDLSLSERHSRYSS